MSAGIWLIAGALLFGQTDLDERYGRLIEQLNCACPSENWTRTLKSCTDACANPQKEEIRAMLAGEKSSEELRRLRMTLLRSGQGALLDKYDPEFAAALVEGERSDQEIIDLFLTRYGPKVIAETPFEGIHILVYLLPPIVLIAGAIGIIRNLRRRVGEKPEATGQTIHEDDPWAKQIEKELEEMS
jgi:cytochrome c-type biogenesis protein CcmH/NrfF